MRQERFLPCQRVLDVNLASIYRTCRAWRPAGVIGLTRQIAVEYADDFVRANCVNPGGIVTELAVNSARLEPGFSL